MRNKIIFFAVIAAISAPAFAEDDSKVAVSVYGILDVGYGNESKTVTTAITGATTKYDQSALQFSGLTSSRLGFLATEDIDGTKATVKVETGLSSNPMAGFSQTSGLTTAQQAALGVNGSGTGLNYGAAGTNGTTLAATTLGDRELNLTLAFTEGTSVKAGYGSTPIRDISLGYAADPGGSLVGNILNNDKDLGSNRQVSLDVIQQIGAVKGTVGLIKDKTSTTNPAGVSTGTDYNGYQLAVQYAQDALAASFAYQTLKSTVTSGALGATTADQSQKIAILGASYDLGVAKLFGEYASIKNADAVAVVAPVVAATGTGSRSYLSFGAQAPVGPAVIFAQISTGTVNRATGTATTNFSAESRKISGSTIGVKYNLSKPTYAYLSLGSTNLKAGVVDPAAAGVKVSQLALGLVHNF